MATQLSKNFTLEEMSFSGTAQRLRIDNTPTPQHIINLTYLCDKILQPLREAWGRPLHVNSGYRSVTVNKALAEEYKKQGKSIHVSNTSQHCVGQAADLTTGNKADNKKLYDLAKKLKLPFDQIINEYDYSWIHLSYKMDGNNRHQELTYK